MASYGEFVMPPPLANGPTEEQEGLMEEIRKRDEETRRQAEEANK